jgi:hypothetical protein
LLADLTGRAAKFNISLARTASLKDMMVLRERHDRPAAMIEK